MGVAGPGHRAATEAPAAPRPPSGVAPELGAPGGPAVSIGCQRSQREAWALQTCSYFLVFLRSKFWFPRLGETAVRTEPFLTADSVLPTALGPSVPPPQSAPRSLPAPLARPTGGFCIRFHTRNHSAPGHLPTGPPNPSGDQEAWCADEQKSPVNFYPRIFRYLFTGFPR